jgi:hypothetical protein
MEAQERGGLQDDGGTDQPARAYEQRAHAGDEAISESEVGGTFLGAIQNQQLVPDENGLGHQGPGAAGAGEPRDGRQQMEKQDGQIAHRPIVASWPHPRNAGEFGIRHAQVRNV